MDSVLARARPFLFGLVVGLLSVGVIWIIARRPQGKPVKLIPPAPAATPSPLRVYIAGAVAAPGVYELPRGSITRDAIAAAGGGTADGDPGRLNLAAPLTDGQQVIVPSIRQPTALPARAAVDGATPLVPDPLTPSASNKVNINTATAGELEALPEIGPSTAAKIVEYRTAHGPFRTIEDITAVKGIGPATFDTIKDLITVASQ
jgi:competence protein ComEA